MRKLLFLFAFATSVVNYIVAQRFEPKWSGQVVILNIDNDTVAIQPEKATVQIKTTQSAGRLLVGIGNVRQKIIIKGSKSPVQVNPDKPVYLIVKAKENDIDPTTFIQVVKFEETRKERKTELANENWLGNISEGNMTFVPYEADIYGKSSYILTIPPQSGEFGVRILNPNERDEKIPVFHCYGAHDSALSVKNNGTTYSVEQYILDNVAYPVYKTKDGEKYIMRSKNDKYFIPTDE